MSWSQNQILLKRLITSGSKLFTLDNFVVFWDLSEADQTQSLLTPRKSCQHCCEGVWVTVLWSVVAVVVVVTGVVVRVELLLSLRRPQHLYNITLHNNTTCLYPDTSSVDNSFLSNAFQLQSHWCQDKSQNFNIQGFILSFIRPTFDHWSWWKYLDKSENWKNMGLGSSIK